MLSHSRLSLCKKGSIYASNRSEGGTSEILATILVSVNNMFFPSLFVARTLLYHSTIVYTVFPRIIAGGDYFFFRTKRGRLFEGGDYFKYFGQRGAIIRGRRLIEGRLLFEEIRYIRCKYMNIMYLNCR